MRVAILFFGFLREWKKCHASIRTWLIDPYAADVFMSSYDIPGYWTPNDQEAIHTPTRYADISQVASEILSAFQPMSLELEPYTLKLRQALDARAQQLSEQHPLARSGLGRKPNILGAYRKVHMCFEAMKAHEQLHGFRYDRVILCRPDFLIHHIQGMDVCALQPNDIHIYQSGGYTLDILYAMHRDGADKICTIYDQMDDLLETGHTWDAHQLFAHAISTHELRCIPYDIQYTVYNTPDGYCRASSI